MQIPCLTIRPNTERPVTMEQGTNRLAGVAPEEIERAIRDALDGPVTGRIPELWDGKAAERIVSILARDLGR